MNIQELNALSEKSIQPTNIKVPLYGHQLAVLHQMLALEKSGTEPIRMTGTTGTTGTGIDQNQSYNSYVNTAVPYMNTDVRFHIGVLGEKPGAGKSYEILSLIAAQKTLPLPTRFENYGQDLITLSWNEFPYFIDCNLLVIPHNLVNQWQTYCETVFSGQYQFIRTRKQLEQFNYAALKAGTYDLVVVTNSVYDMFIEKVKKLFTSSLHTIGFPLFNRIIFDEFDGSKVSLTHRVEAIFYWVITASYKNVLDPYHRRGIASDLLKGASYLHVLVRKLSISNIPDQVLAKMVVKCEDSYVDSCFYAHRTPMVVSDAQENVVTDVVQEHRTFEIVEPVYSRIMCHAPRALSILNGIVSSEIMEFINSHNLQGAMDKLGLKQVKDETDLVEAVTESFKLEIERLKNKLSVRLVDEAVRQNAEDKIRGLESKILMIQERMKGCCSICYGDEMETRTLLNCCNNCYCFECILKWVQTRAVCPMCKAPVKKENLIIVNGLGLGLELELEDKSTNNNNIHVNFGFDMNKDKLENLSILLKQLLDTAPNKKILLFANSDNPLEMIMPVLKEMNVTHAALRGNSGSFRNLINKYVAGDIQVLLMNSKHCGCGLNLHMTTDLIMFHKFNSDMDRQIVGRAQRPGRDSQLKVWYLLHEGHETPI